MTCNMLETYMEFLTYYAFVKVPLDGDQNISQSGAEVRGWVHVLRCPHVMAHLHQHVEGVEAVDLVAKSDKTVEFGLNTVEDLIHHQPHHVFTGVAKWMKVKKRLIRQSGKMRMNVQCGASYSEERECLCSMWGSILGSVFPSNSSVSG